jgi:hypothetical protein
MDAFKAALANMIKTKPVAPASATAAAAGTAAGGSSKTGNKRARDEPEPAAASKKAREQKETSQPATPAAPAPRSLPRSVRAMPRPLRAPRIAEHAAPPNATDPCSWPFVGPIGIPLGFNWWYSAAGRGEQVLTTDLRDVMVAVMSGSSATELPAPWLAPEALHGVERILIANVQGLDMRAATSGLVRGGQAPFLRQCTSVPTRHSLIKHGNMNPPLQALRSSALLLWQETPPLPLHKVQQLSVEELFKKHVLYFQVDRKDLWSDQMIMYWEPMNMKRDACVMAAKEAAAAASAVDEAAAAAAAAAAAKAARAAHFAAGGIHGSAAATAASVAAAKKARAAAKDAAGKQAVQDAAAATTAGLQGHCQRQTAPGYGRWSLVKSSTGTYIMTICWNNKPHDIDILILQGGGWHREVKGGDCPDMPFATAVSELVFTTWVEPKTKGMKKVAPVKGPPRNPLRMSLSQATARDAEEMGSDAPPTAVAGTNVRATALGAGVVPAEVLARPKRARPTWTLLEPELANINAENFSLTPSEKYRLNIPTSVQAEGQGYVSTIDGRRAADAREHEDGQVAMDMDVDAATAAAVLGAATSPAAAVAAAAAAAAEDAMDVAVAANSAADEAAAADAAAADAAAAGAAAAGADGDANGDAPPPAAAAAAAAASSASAAAAGAAAAAAVLADLSAAEQTPFERALTVAAKSADPFVCPSPALLIPSNGIWADGSSKGYKLLGLDCEMVYTANGLELARATIVNARGVCLYDRYVLPSSPIINYNTEYSGVTAEHMAGVTRTLAQCQDDILQLIDAQTYIVGHSLDSDMRALRLVHNRLIDTSILYPTVKGAPYKQGLRTLCCAVLGRDVQVGSGTRCV